MIKLKMLTVRKNLSRKPGRNVKLLKKSTLKRPRMKNFLISSTMTINIKLIFNSAVCTCQNTPVYFF